MRDRRLPVPRVTLISRLTIKVNSAYVRNAITVTLALVAGKLLLSG